MVGTSKNKNIDHQGKHTCAYESDYISLFCDLTILVVGTSKNKNINHHSKHTCAYESDHCLFCDLTILSLLNCTRVYFIYFIATQKKKIILEEK